MATLACDTLCCTHPHIQFDLLALPEGVGSRYHSMPEAAFFVKIYQLAKAQIARGIMKGNAGYSCTSQWSYENDEESKLFKAL